MGNIKLLFNFWKYFSINRKKQFYLLLVLSVVVSIADVISVGAVLPLLWVLTEPEKMLQDGYIGDFAKYLMISDGTQLVYTVVFIFIFLVVIAAILRVALVWSQTRFSQSIGTDVSVEIFKRYLYQPYEFFLATSSSELTSDVLMKSSSVVNRTILPTMVVISSSVFMIAAVATLVLIDPIMSLSVFTMLGAVYVSIYYFVRGRLYQNSKKMSVEIDYVTKILNEGFGHIRDIILDSNHSYYINNFSKSDAIMRRADGNVKIIGIVPKYFIESLSISLIVLIAVLYAYEQDGLSKIIPTLGVIVSAAQKLLPAAQQIYSNWSHVQGGRKILHDVLQVYEREICSHLIDDRSDEKEYVFRESIQFNNVSFRYAPESEYVLKDINIKINKGDRVGIIGASGSGKTTLLDVLMGLLTCTNGGLAIDDRLVVDSDRYLWSKHIAHVPQDIFIFDASIKENITNRINDEDIDSKLIYEILQRTQLLEYTDNNDDGVDAFTGERGVRLSGGQRQRLGIARALYKKSNIIIFDEATSALDYGTEEKIMKTIEEIGSAYTIIIVAHRLSTLKVCNNIIELKNGMIHRVGSYSDLIQDT
jgi:ATP-binding cassette, subfamily B, bacterial PglK